MTRKLRIAELLKQKLSPTYLNVEDESHHHHVPENAQTHFKVTLVSSELMNTTRVARHRLVNQLLSEEFALGMHALSLHLYTPEEWSARGESVLKSPNCRDGFNK